MKARGMLDSREERRQHIPPMPSRKAWAALLSLAASSCSSAPRLPEKPDGSAVLEVTGAFKGSPRSLGAGDLARLARRSVKGVDPVSGRSATWEGLDLAEVVRRAQPERADTVVVRSADGVAVPLTMNALLQYRPVIADRADGEALGTPRLAWPNLDQPGLMRDPRHRAWWLTGPVAVEIASWPIAYGRKLAPPPGSPEGARPGAGLFVQRCVVCHQLRSAGGTRGPDLTRWAGKGSLEALSARLRDHPGRFPDDLEQDLVPPLWSYLQAIDRAPPLPPEPPPGEKGTKARGAPDEPDVDEEQPAGPHHH
jgi:hypothetical protein